MYTPGTLAIRNLVVMLLLSAAIGYLIWDRYNRFTTGREIVVKVVNQSPREIFFEDGEPMQLSISRLERANVSYEDNFERGQKVYVTLQKSRTGFYEPIRVTADQPSVSSEQAVIRGRVTFRSRRSNRRTIERPMLNVSYGVENNLRYAPKAEIRSKLTRNAQIGAVLKIGNRGLANLSALTVNGERVYEDPIF